MHAHAQVLPGIAALDDATAAEGKEQEKEKEVVVDPWTVSGKVGGASFSMILNRAVSSSQEYVRPRRGTKGLRHKGVARTKYSDERYTHGRLL